MLISVRGGGLTDGVPAPQPCEPAFCCRGRRCTWSAEARGTRRRANLKERTQRTEFVSVCAIGPS